MADPVAGIVTETEWALDFSSYSSSVTQDTGVGSTIGCRLLQTRPPQPPSRHLTGTIVAPDPTVSRYQFARIYEQAIWTPNGGDCVFNFRLDGHGSMVVAVFTPGPGSQSLYAWAAIRQSGQHAFLLGHTGDVRFNSTAVDASGWSRLEVTGATISETNWFKIPHNDTYGYIPFVADRSPGADPIYFGWMFQISSSHGEANSWDGHIDNFCLTLPT